MAGPRDPGASFAQGINFLQAYYLREGHCAVPRTHREGYFALGLWVEDARARREAFTVAQQRELSGLDGWTWGGTDRRSRTDRVNFNAGLRDLRAFVAEHNHARVPQTEDGKLTPLGSWTKLRRREYIEDTLSIDEIEALDAVVGWFWDQQQADFSAHVESLRQYAVEHGTAHVPSHHRDEMGFALGRWAANQRRLEKHGKLAPARAVLLRQVPFWV